MALLVQISKLHIHEYIISKKTDLEIDVLSAYLLIKGRRDTGSSRAVGFRSFDRLMDHAGNAAS